MKALDFMDRKADGTPRKKHRLLILLCLLIFIALFIPQGGEIYEPDFLFGYDVYVRPSYVFAEDAQLQTWKVTDRNTESSISRDRMQHLQLLKQLFQDLLKVSLQAEQFSLKQRCRR